MKKGVILVIAFAMIISSAGCSMGKENHSIKNQLIIGQTTQLTGDFGNGFTSGAADACVKSLINGYSTVVYTRDGTYEINPTVVEKFHSTDHEDGSKTFYFKLYEDLVYNTGLQITAKDYLFSILLGSCEEYEALGAYATAGADYLGYTEFYQGETNSFEGLRLYDDYEFSVTVTKEQLPYYYELTLVALSPTPIEIYAPNVSLFDVGDGATLSNNFDIQIIEEPIKEQRFFPNVTCGPYQLLNYDQSSKQAILTRNDNYKGTYDGKKPEIERLIFRQVQEETMLDELASGSVDLLMNVSGGVAINAGLDLVEQGRIGSVSYLRNGYGKLTFVCDYGPTQFQSVRQAIAYCFDRNEFAAQYSGGFAQVIHGYYGLGQWQYQKMKDKVANGLNLYSKDITKAKQILEEDGWIYNAKGELYQDGVDHVRCKRVNGELMPCVIRWGSVENIVSQLIATMLPEAMEDAGMRLVITSIDFSVLLNSLSKEGGSERDYHMFNMGVSLPRVFDPYYYYSTDKKYDAYNDNKLYDKKLSRLAKELRETNRKDTKQYLDKWYEFEVRWNELLPDLPLYSDEYHDFFNLKLKNYEVSADWGGCDQLVYCSIKD